MTKCTICERIVLKGDICYRCRVANKECKSKIICSKLSSYKSEDRKKYQSTYIDQLIKNNKYVTKEWIKSKLKNEGFCMWCGKYVLIKKFTHLNPNQFILDRFSYLIPHIIDNSFISCLECYRIRRQKSLNQFMNVCFNFTNNQ